MKAGKQGLGDNKPCRQGTTVQPDSVHRSVVNRPIAWTKEQKVEYSAQMQYGCRRSSKISSPAPSQS